MSKPLSKFIKSRKSYAVDGLNKSDTIHCPDCDGILIKAEEWQGCLCYGDLVGKGLILKKNDSGIKAEFSEDWDSENISLLLEVLRSKNKDLG